MQDKGEFMPVSSHRKHIHHWNKSLAGGFRCACEAWRCEFAEGLQQCEDASEQGRKYCPTHRVSGSTSVSAIRAPRTSTTPANSQQEPPVGCNTTRAEDSMKLKS